MATKPTVKPKWAEDDVFDPGSGTDNVAEPSEAKKLRGWDDAEIPPRQWWNWLQRIIYRWIDWLDGTTIPLSSDVGTANEQLSDGTGHTHALNGASQVEAEEGTDNEKVMTPLRVAQAITTQVGASAEGHCIEASAYTGQSFDGVAQETTAAQDLAISSDGLKLYIYQAGGVSELFEYDLSSPFEISTATYNSVSLDMSSENTFLSVEFSDDGLKLWGTVSGIIYPYTLTTAWDISTASYDGATVDLTAQDTIQTISFSPDGLRMAAAGNTNDNIYTYTLSSAWDISTATYDGVALDYSGEVTASEIKLSVSSNGSKLFLGRAASGGGIIEYDLLNSWDLTTVLRTINHTQFGTGIGGYNQQHFTFSPVGDFLLIRSSDPLSPSDSLVLSFATGILR